MNRELAEVRAMLKSQADDFTARIEKLQSAIQVLERKLAHKLAAESAESKPGYLDLIRGLRKAVRSHVPHDATVIVISKGDNAMLRLQGRRAWHFPRQADGTYPGFAPADSGSAIVQLEALRSQGAEFLIIPATAFWWLDFYAGLRRHLERHYRLVMRDDAVGAIYELRHLASQGAAGESLEFFLQEFGRRFDREPDILDWRSGMDLAARFNHCRVFSPPACDLIEPRSKLPYLEGTVDVVVVRSPSPTALAEARRVACGAIVTVNSTPRQEPAPVVQIEWLSDGEAAELPSTSIIIPTYNGVALVEACLTALTETLPPGFRGEILVLDDGSTDNTRDRMTCWTRRDKRIRFEHNKRNLGFLLTCNRAAELARGDVLVFLNNDTLPQAGWLTPVLRMFRERPDAGAVGGKLVYPDGRLQDAGGVIFSDGSGANFGRNDYRIDEPLYNYVREVDYVTGAMFATRREVFAALGGFDTRYRPAYYEETDYCFRLREKGYKVYYQPASLVIHLEGMTCGTDTCAGVKRYQEINRAKFVDRWRTTLLRQPPNPGFIGESTWQVLAIRDESEAPRESPVPQRPQKTTRLCMANEGGT